MDCHKHIHDLHNFTQLHTLIYKKDCGNIMVNNNVTLSPSDARYCWCYSENRADLTGDLIDELSNLIDDLSDEN